MSVSSGGSRNKVQLKISLEAKDLKKAKVKGVPDTYAVVTVIPKAKSGKEEKVIGRTEIVKSSFDPQWTRELELDHVARTKQYINIGIYQSKKGKETPIDSEIFEVSEVMKSEKNKLSKTLKKSGITVFVKIKKAKKKSLASSLVLQLSGSNLKNVETLLGGKTDPFFEITAENDDDEEKVVYRSNVLSNNLNPEWEEGEVDIGNLCQEDVDKFFFITVYDYEETGKHVYVGKLKTSLRELIEKQRSRESLTLLDFSENVGKINVLVAHIMRDGKNETLNEFIDTNEMNQTVSQPSTRSIFKDKGKESSNSSLTGGLNPYNSKRRVGKNPPLNYPEGEEPSANEYKECCDISLTIAIDFSGSNGDPRIPTSLHYMGHPPGKLNDYEEAIVAVASILKKYDKDETYPVWGFGVKYGGKTQHCFQCGPDPEVVGVDGILKAYRNVMRGPIVMSSPTDLTGVINHAAQTAKEALAVGIDHKHRLAYSILLILTDGSVNCVNTMMSCLGSASSAPLSIIIVGVGRSDFGAMKFLDEFTVQDSRDICQFIEFETHKRNLSALTRATLEEIPEQIVGFFVDNNIPPHPDYSKIYYSSEIDEYDDDYDDSSAGYSQAKSLLVVDPRKNAFKVQVPPGVSPGTTIKVESPYTSREYELIIPFGVPPGGTWVVNG